MIHQLSNKFEILSRRVMNKGISSGEEMKNNRKAILRKEKLKEGKKEKKEKLAKVRKVEDRKLLRKITVKVELERTNIQEDNGRDIVE